MLSLSTLLQNAEETKEIVLQPGEKFDRYGLEDGYYVSPCGTSYRQRALAPGTYLKPYHIYEVIKPFQVQSGKIKKWFDEPGGGTQHVLPQTIEELLDNRTIRRIR